MKKTILFLILLLMAATVDAGILFYDDCENMWTSEEWLTANTGGGNTITVSTAQKRGGASSYKFVLAPYGGAAETNVELLLRGLNSPIQLKNFIIGQEYWMGYSIFIPQWWSYTDFWTSPQFHLAQDACDMVGQGPNVGFFMNSSHQYVVSIGGSITACQTLTSQFNRDSSVFTTPALNIGSWNDIVINFKFNYDGTQFYRMWVNGVGPQSTTHINAANDAKGPYLKVGIYAHASEEMTVYYDEIKFGDQNSSYAEVAPTGSQNTPPVVVISPSTTQTIADEGTVDFSCTATDSDGTVSTMWIDYEDSGISQDSSSPGTSPATLDPAVKTFSIVGTFNVKCFASDNGGFIGSDDVTVIVGVAPPITGLINEWNLESGAIETDTQSNEVLVNNGTITSEGTGTEPNPPGYGTHGVTLNGTNQYFSVAAWDASNPWQTLVPSGTFAITLKTPSSYPTSLKYLGGSYDTDSNRKIAFILDDTTLDPIINIGISDGTGFETKYMGAGLSLSTIYTLIFTTDGTAKTWSIDVYNHSTAAWLTRATGSISGTMNLAGTAAWNFGRRSDALATTYFPGTIYWMYVYNNVLTGGEMIQLVEGEYTEPPTGFTIESMCLSDCDTDACISSDKLLWRNEDVCLKTILSSGSWNYAGPYSNFAIPFPLDAGGNLEFLYYRGEGTNQWVWKATVGEDDLELGNLELTTVNDLDRDRTGDSNSTIVDGSGDELSSYALPQTTADPTYKVWVKGTPGIRFKAQ